MDTIQELLEEGRAREKDQTLFYRALAADAGAAGLDELVERLNDLHADEQHHLSRLTARILELGKTPRALPPQELDLPSQEDWEQVARAREEEEVLWYREALKNPDLDSRTQAVLEEILASEEHHSRDLSGKWMSA